jgi:hypothetical protein
MDLLKCSNINLELIKFNDPIFNDDNKKFESLIAYNLNDFITPLILKSSRVRVINVDKKCDTGKNIITIQFLREYPKFYNFVCNFENFIVDTIYKNGNNWFGSEPNYDSIDNLLKRSVKLPLSLDDCPTMEIMISDDCSFHNKNDEQCFIDDLKQNNEVELIFCINRVEFNHSKYTIIYTIEAIKITNYFCQKNICLFENLDDLDSCSEISETGYANFTDTECD